MSARQLHFATTLVQPTQRSDDGAFQAPVAQLALNSQCRLEVRACLHGQFLRLVQRSKVDESNTFGESRACLAVNGQRLFQMETGLFHPALLVAEATQIVVGV